MGLLTREKSIDLLEKEKERLEVEEEVLTKRASVAEKEAIIKQLKKQYGRNWMKSLGFSKMPDLQTLRSVLGSWKKGLIQSQGGDSTSSRLDPRPGGKVVKA